MVKWKTSGLKRRYTVSYLQPSWQARPVTHLRISCTNPFPLVILAKGMQILFAISALCFIGILWAALALARHIKAGRLNNPLTPAHPDFKHHLFAALAPLPPTHSATHLTSASTTRPTTILHQSVRDITAKKQWTLPPQAMHMSRLIPRITEPYGSRSNSP